MIVSVNFTASRGGVVKSLKGPGRPPAWGIYVQRAEIE
jgi:hypothetical protein